MAKHGKRLSKKRRKIEAEIEKAQAWKPRPDRGKDRPTPERLALGKWALMSGDEAGIRHAKDFEAHPIDELEHKNAITNSQASAGRDFESLVRSATETTATRDSCMTWQPKGYESDDGNVNAVRDRQELYLFLGIIRDRQLRRVCVEHVAPKSAEIGILREALNEAERFFSHGRKPR